MVLVNGERHVYGAGDANLTNAILHDDQLAADWVKAMHGVDTEVVQIDGCGSAGQPYAASDTHEDDSDTVEVVEEQAPPPPPPPPVNEVTIG